MVNFIKIVESYFYSSKNKNLVGKIKRITLMKDIPQT